MTTPISEKMKRRLPNIKKGHENRTCFRKTATVSKGREKLSWITLMSHGDKTLNLRIES